MKRSTVGVVIPSFNRPKQLKKALESVLTQTHPLNQVIIVDDGSLPENRVKISKIAKDYSADLIMSPALRHPGKMRQLGLQEISTEWVAFLDDDDIWLPNKIEIQLEHAARFNKLAIASNAFRMSDGEPLLGKMHANVNVNLKKLLGTNLIINSSVMVKTSLLKNLGGYANQYNVRGVEDYATWLRIATILDWHVIKDSLLFYSDDSADSIRIPDEYGQKNINSFAHIDHLDWLLKNGRNKILSRIILKIFAKSLN